MHWPVSAERYVPYVCFHASTQPTWHTSTSADYFLWYRSLSNPSNILHCPCYEFGINWCAVIVIYTPNICVDIARVALWAALRQAAAYYLTWHPQCWALLEQRASRSSSHLWCDREDGWNGDVFSTLNALFRIYSTCMQMTITAAASYLRDKHKASSTYIASIMHISHGRILFGEEYACACVGKAERWFMGFQCCVSCLHMHCCSWSYRWSLAHEMSLSQSTAYLSKTTT